MTRDELLERLRTFEWNDFECKKALRGVPEDAYRTVSAFANTAGGWLVFGVSERNGQLEITGVEAFDQVQNDFLSTLRGGQKLNRLIAVEPHVYDLEGKRVLAFHVPESSHQEKPIYLRGDPRQSYIRRGAGDEQCSPSELQRFLRDAASTPYDSELLPDISVERCFDEETIRWYQALFTRRHPEYAEITDPLEFLVHWNYIAEQGTQQVPTQAGILLFGKDRYVRQILPRPVLDYQRIDTRFDSWSPEERWHDRVIFEENIFQTWRGLVAKYMRIAEHPFSLDPATLRRNDDPPDYVAFREAAINLLIHQDYGDWGRKASIKLFTDRTAFWNPGDAFATDAELLDPTEKELRNPAIVKAFRRIGLSDQAGTGIRAIYRNWRELGRMLPRLNNDKARKQFELVLLNSPLITDAMHRFQQTLGVNLTSEQADILALAADRPRVTMTEIRALTGGSYRDARAAIGYLAHQQLLEVLEDQVAYTVPALFKARLNQLAEGEPGKKVARVQVGTKLGPSWDQVRTEYQLDDEQRLIIHRITKAHGIGELMDWVGRSNRTKFRDQILTPLLEAGLVEMTIPDKPRSSKQKYHLTAAGHVLQAQLTQLKD